MIGDRKQENKGDLYSQKGNHGIGHMSGGEIKGNAKVAGTIEEKNKNRSQKIVNNINIHPPNKPNSSKRENNSASNPKTIKLSIKEGDKEASLEAPHSVENFKMCLDFLRQRFDNSLGVKDIEKSSIKFILKGSEEGLKNIAESFESGELAPLLKQQFNLELEDAKLIDSNSSEDYQKNQSQKLLAFTISGNVSQADIDLLKDSLIDTSEKKEIKNDKKFRSTKQTILSTHPIEISISSSIIHVGGSTYRTERIEKAYVVKVKASALSVMTRGRIYAILIKFIGGGIKLLVQSRDKKQILKIFYEIKKAIVENSRGNPNFSSSMTINGDLTNQVETEVNDKVMIVDLQ